MRIPFIAGNWKMFKTGREVVTFAEDFKKLYQDTDVRTAVCAPYVYLGLLKNLFSGTKIKVGAQNAFYEDEGAFTGEVSVKMLEDLGVDYCIIGHSERRQYFGETDEIVNKKLKRLLAGPITPILCVGENLQQREKEEQYLVVRDQLIWALSGITPQQAAKIVIAYEPVWAIGTGKTATPQQAEDMCEFIRNAVEALYGEEVADQVVIQYGGSVKPANATDIMDMPNIDGALVGGASLNASDFMEIIDF
ncbi:triose-phosphate isomerase [Zhenpiania hominis]|uniref:Triosephosphate isomerase n=1 Tax=Zhenpiania hominis TaxID=2763644 RepID=A0A923NJM8_9FIRM|nr:triose-phosphate isomerase [Zhenpiania hominis]MBC6680298.1 triose-phosphate isomerase [Zhenpiania hominis]